MNEPISYTFHFPVECREEGDSTPPAGRRRRTPTTMTMPKVSLEAQQPSDAPLAPPNGRESGLTARPSHVELIVPPADLEQDGGQRFLQKIAGVLADRPGAVVVQVDGLGEVTHIGLLLRARADAARDGVRLVVRPIAPAHRERLRQLGVGELLGL